ncbi:SGNH/GDSL hydrolase family protein [Leptolyngbya ohadii]|uniref:SGNH/GDSL hydrolase family protein n=1 Tax=Leptolyngbya ohadii TaxID=1962290 RepID=UPI000B5A02E6|nr:SGNH/GDSL hydrolase family protein [Leptolyngbya ohadii]
MRYRVKLPLLLASVALLTGLLPTRTIAAPFEKLYVFGDSLSDTGNVFNASKQFLGTGSPPPPYYEGRFSNGPVWIDYLAQKLNLTPQPIAVLENPQNQENPSESVNFAYGGATTGTSSSLNAVVPGLQTQVREFKQLLANQAADPNALFVIWMGANDYLSAVNRADAATEPNPAVPVQNITVAIESLYQSGARHFLVANLPDLGETPLAKQQGNRVVQTLTQLSDRHNQLLSQRLDELQRNLPDLHLLRLDIGKLYVNTAEAQTFDLSNPCYSRATGAVCAQPDRHLFWDNLHPTTAAHREISENALALIDRPTAVQPTSLPLAGLSAIGTIGILAGAGAFWRHRRHQTKG